MNKQKCDKNGASMREFKDCIIRDWGPVFPQQINLPLI